jgi:GT2 family glycosyltransferase
LPDVAVAVVSWNTRDLLAACLRSLEPDAAAGRAEVWVVDNASGDGSAELVREGFGWARLVPSTRNLGFGPAVNLVAESTATPWIAPANADVELAPGALERLLAAGARLPDAGALAPRLVLPGGVTQHSVYAFPTLPFTAAFNLGLARVVPGLGDRLCLMGDWDAERARWVDWAVGAFLVVRREAWDEAGGFDTDQWMYAEDLDLGWRLRRAGWRTRYVPDAVVHHHESAATTQAWGDERTARWQAATYAWMLRRRGALRTRAAAGMNVAGAAGRAAWMTPLARRRPARWGWRREANVAWARLHARTGFGAAPRLPDQR